MAVPRAKRLRSWALPFPQQKRGFTAHGMTCGCRLSLGTLQLTQRFCIGDPGAGAGEEFFTPLWCSGGIAEFFSAMSDNRIRDLAIVSWYKSHRTALRCMSLSTISTHLTHHFLRAGKNRGHGSCSRLADPALRECCFMRRDASENLGGSVRGCELSYLGMGSVVPEPNHRFVEIVFVA